MPPAGSRQRLQALGPEGFAAALRAQSAVAVTDTTMRDAHQSLLATRVRTRDLTAVAGHLARMTPELLSLEAWGGATYDVALRFLAEDPWERLAALRTAVPNICLQMLLRGRNTVGYTPYPTGVTDAFVAEAAETGVDIFRIFDALNNVDQMRPAIDAVRSTGTALAEVCLCYTGDLSDPGETLYTLDYYLRLAERIVDAGAHVLADQGHGRPAAGAGSPHPGPCACASDSTSRCTSTRTTLRADSSPRWWPRSMRASTRSTRRAPPSRVRRASRRCPPWWPAPTRPSAPRVSRCGALCDLEPYWEATRRLYAPFESGLPAPTGRVYSHEIPGGQLSNLRQQAIALGLGEKFEQVEDMYAAANDILGNIVKVTPSSKVVGDLALQLVAVGADPQAFAADPGLVRRAGVGHRLPRRASSGTRRAAGRSRSAPRRSPAGTVRIVETEIDPADRSGLAGPAAVRRTTLNRLLFPGPAQTFAESRERYSDLSVLPTRAFLYGLSFDDEHDVYLTRAYG